MSMVRLSEEGFFHIWSMMSSTPLRFPLTSSPRLGRDAHSSTREVVRRVLSALRILSWMGLGRGGGVGFPLEVVTVSCSLGKISTMNGSSNWRRLRSWPSCCSRYATLACRSAASFPMDWGSRRPVWERT